MSGHRQGHGLSRQNAFGAGAGVGVPAVDDERACKPSSKIGTIKKDRSCRDPIGREHACHRPLLFGEDQGKIELFIFFDAAMHACCVKSPGSGDTT